MAHRKMVVKPNGVFLASGLWLAFSATTTAIAQDSIQQDTDLPSMTLDKIVVTAKRDNSTLKDSAQKVLLVTQQDIEKQLAVTNDVSTVLSNLIPGYAPPSSKFTGNTETFRGRSALILIDGVPQSNALRQDNRAMTHSIDLSMVERIEVIYGASADQGLGATGGVINFITKRPTTGKPKQTVGVTINSDDEFHSDGFGGKINYQISGTNKDVEYLFGASYADEGLHWDANNDKIAVARSGDIMNSQSYDVLAKIGYWFDEDKHLSLSANYFDLEGKHNYVTVNGNRANNLPATTADGTPEGLAPYNKIWSGSLNYSDSDFFGTNLNAQIYHQSYKGRFAGNRSNNFRILSNGVLTTIYDQSENQSVKHGAKVTVNKKGLLDGKLGLTAGADFLQDKSEQVLVMTGRNWVPEMKMTNYAPFIQSKYQLSDKLTVNAGVRHEMVKLAVDDYYTLENYGSRFVQGGKPDFNQTLWNAGLIYDFQPNTQLYTSFSQGYTIVDIGNILRDVRTDGVSVDNLIDLEPVLTDSYEIGVRTQQGRWNAGLSYYLSEADRGTTMELDTTDGHYKVNRKKTQVQGADLDIAWQATDNQKITAHYAYIKGKKDNDNNGSLETEMSAIELAPQKLGLGYQYRFDNKSTVGLQANHYFSKDYPVTTTSNGKFNGYTLVDFAYTRPIAKGTMTFGVGNLFNEFYFPLESQLTALPTNENYFTGRGRYYTLGYQWDF